MLPCHQSVQHSSEDVGEQCHSSEFMDNLSKHRAGQECEPSPPTKDYVPTIASSPQRSNASPLDAAHVLQLFPQIQAKPAAERESSSRRLDQVPTETFGTFKQRVLFVCEHMWTPSCYRKNTKG